MQDNARGRAWEVQPYPAVGQRPCGQFLYWKSHDRASAGIKFHKYAFSDSGKNMGPGTPSAAACARSFSLFRKASPYPFPDKTACRPSAFPGRPAVCPPSICRIRIRPQTEGFSLCNRKGNAVHRMHIACRMGNNAAPDGIIFFQVFYPDQRLLLRVFFFHIYAHLHVSPSLASIHLTKCPSPICL